METFSLCKHDTVNRNISPMLPGPCAISLLPDTWNCGLRMRRKFTSIAFNFVFQSLSSWYTYIVLSQWCYMSFMASRITRTLSVRPSVRPSVRLWHLFHNVPVMVSSWTVQGYYQWQRWCPCKKSTERSKVKVTEVKTPFIRLQTITPVWIHIRGKMVP